MWLLREAFPEWDKQSVATFFSPIGLTEPTAPPPVPADQLAAWFRRRATKAGIKANHTYTPTYRRKFTFTDQTKMVTRKAVKGWKLHSAVIPSEEISGSALPANFGVLDIRHMAWLLRIPAPPDHLVNSWNEAKARADGTT